MNPRGRMAGMAFVGVWVVSTAVYALMPGSALPSAQLQTAPPGETSGRRHAPRTVRKIQDAPAAQKGVTTIDRAYQEVAEQLDDRWIRCEADVQLPPSFQVDGVRRHRLDEGVFRGMVSTENGGGIITPLFEEAPCDADSLKGLMDCRVEEQERKRDAEFPVATLQWSGAERGAVGGCSIRSVERVVLHGRVEGARMGAVWACGVRVLTRDGTFEVEGYAHTSCVFRFDDGSAKSEVRLPTGDGGGEFIIPQPRKEEGLTELEKQVLALETAEAAMAQPSPLDSVLEAVDGDHRSLIEAWQAEEWEARVAAVAEAQRQIDAILGMEESMERLREKQKEWSKRGD